MTDVAEQLCRKRDAQIIDGMGADDFFAKLAEKVDALKAMEAPHPLSAKLAVATQKKYMVDEKDRIRLHDLVMEEANRVANGLFGDLGNHRQGLHCRNTRPG